VIVDAPVHHVGPLRIATSDVLVRTNCDHFARAATALFADLATAPHHEPSTGTVAFDTIKHQEPTVHWSVHRDGEPCELQLRHDAVMVHQQWEFNRLAIVSQPCAIHAAAVGLEGHGVLLAGSSYSGKTTLAGWLVSHHHASYIADEVSAIDGQLMVRPFARPLGVRADSPLAAAAPPLTAEARDFMPDERLVPVSDLGGTLATTPVPVGLIVFPRFDPSATLSANSVSPADALVRLAALTPGLTDHGREVFERLRRLADTAPAIELHYDDVRAAAPMVQFIPD
jgi:hypothetical protein